MVMVMVKISDTAGIWTLHSEWTVQHVNNHIFCVSVYIYACMHIQYMYLSAGFTFCVSDLSRRIDGQIQRGST